MPEEYIKRSDVLKKAICLIQGPPGEEHLRFCAVPVDDIQKIPAADVAPVVHGKFYVRGIERKKNITRKLG